MSSVEQRFISGVAKDTNVVSFALMGVKDEPGVAFKIFRRLAMEKINIDIILQSVGRGHTQDISFTVASADREKAEQVLVSNKASIGYEKLTVTEDVAKVSVVGAGMMSNHGVAAAMFEALYNAKINIIMISTSEIKVSVLVNEADADRAVASIHAKFFE